MSRPVSWLLVEPGWTVRGTDGDLGRVEQVVGDADKDIFDGLAVASGLFAAARYVPAERVRAIQEGCIDVDVGAAEFERLEEHRDVTARRFRPG
jgi:hypothetical protein